MTVIETHSGIRFDLQSPRHEDVKLEDIAHALAHTCRFGGHCDRFYSVAEHAVRVSRCFRDSKLALLGLHHDDAEAYLGDIPRPLKPLLGSVYADLTRRVDAAIAIALGIYWTSVQLHLPAIKEADDHLLLVEARAMLPSRGEWWESPKPRRAIPYLQLGWTPETASRMYLAEHARLIEEHA